MIKAIAQEIDFLAPPKTPMGGPHEPKILSVMSFPFLQQWQDLGRRCTTAAAGEDSMNAHVDDDNVVRVIDLFVKSLNMLEPTFYPKPIF